MISRYIGNLFFKFQRIYSHFIREYQKSLFLKFGKGSFISTGCHFTFSTISIGSNTYIGKNCIFQSAHGKIEIGNNVMFGAGVHIHGGNHTFNRVGMLMREVTKSQGEDGLVRISDDAWIGSNTIILKGVCIGEGAVVGAGSIVTHDIPAYSIAVGNPAKVIKQRFTPAELERHISLITKKSEL